VCVCVCVCVCVYGSANGAGTVPRLHLLTHSEEGGLPRGVSGTVATTTTPTIAELSSIKVSMVFISLIHSLIHTHVLTHSLTHPLL
jgi:hypothetical protein